ncbi:uncharacterized protein [Scyliorhinus torazame]|uniref:uncharacterized protein isoform X2 n=1 Tax=Scyliorhinus torazame TaxID=75743 RepID=UPI003B58F8DF
MTRELSCSTSCSKVQSVHTLRTGCKDVIKKSPRPNRISTGHFTAWGVEDNEVLYYMLKDGQSVGTAFVPTSCEEGPKSSQRLQNYNNNCRNEEERYTISPFRAIQTKVKRKHFATWMTSDSRTNPKTLFYSHFSEKPVNKSVTSFSKASSKCVERNSPNSLGVWICDTCSINNAAPAVRCRGCEVLKCGIALQRQWTPAADESKGTQTNEMNTQAQSSDICVVTIPQNIDVTEMLAPLATSSCSHITEVICPVPQTVASANTSSISIVELLPAGSECVNVLLPTEVNPTACLLAASAGSGHDENLPRGKRKQQKSVQKDRNSLTPDKSDTRKSCNIQESSISISFPRVFGPPSNYTTNSCTGLSMVACPASSKSDMTTTAVASTSFQVPTFIFGCSNEAGRNNINSETFASSVTFPSVFGQTCSTLTSGVVNAGLTDNPSSAQFTGAGFHFSGNMVPNCNFSSPTNNNVFQFGANVPTQPTCQESFHLSPITTTRSREQGKSRRKTGRTAEAEVIARRQRQQKPSGRSKRQHQHQIHSRIALCNCSVIVYPGTQMYMYPPFPLPHKPMPTYVVKTILRIVQSGCC